MKKGNRNLQFGTPVIYSNKVLTGKWLEDRQSKLPEVIEKCDYTTTYTTNFAPKPYVKPDSERMWSLRLDNEENNFISQMGRQDHPSYFENFTSTYDLAYNHFPKCFKSQIPRKLRFRMLIHEPTNEYLSTFGNLTKFGLLDYSKQKWTCEVRDPRVTAATVYQETFAPPSADSYKFRRWGIPLPNSSIMIPSNMQSTVLNLRGQPVFGVPAPDKLVQVCRPKRCNPITWECPSLQKVT